MFDIDIVDLYREKLELVTFYIFQKEFLNQTMFIN